MDVVTVEERGPYGALTLNSKKLSALNLGPKHQLIIDLDQCAQKYGLFVPEFHREREFIRLTYRYPPKYLTLLIYELNDHIEIIKGNGKDYSADFLTDNFEIYIKEAAKVLLKGQ